MHPYTVYSVFPTSALSYTIQKILASMSISSRFLFFYLIFSHYSKCPSPFRDQRGISSAIPYLDAELLRKSLRNSIHCWQYAFSTKAGWPISFQYSVLSLFARIAQIPFVDPTRNQRHRRASSASSHSSRSERDLTGSRSSSRTGQRPSSMSGNSHGQSTENQRTSISGLDSSSYQWAEKVPK